MRSARAASSAWSASATIGLVDDTAGSVRRIAGWRRLNRRFTRNTRLQLEAGASRDIPGRATPYGGARVSVGP